MSQLLIEIDTPEDEELLLALLPKLNARIVGAPAIQARKADLIKIMEEMAAKEIGKAFGDASEWQREIRSWDRVLDGREE